MPTQDPPSVHPPNKSDWLSATLVAVPSTRPVHWDPRDHLIWICLIQPKEQINSLSNDATNYFHPPATSFEFPCMHYQHLTDYSHCGLPVLLQSRVLSREWKWLCLIICRKIIISHSVFNSIQSILHLYQPKKTPKKLEMQFSRKSENLLLLIIIQF